VNARLIIASIGVEWAKVSMHNRNRALVALCALAPFLFIAIMQAQTNLPTDTLFGRELNETGFATPLVILGFAGLWVLPVLASIAGGEMFAAEDRYRTWSTILTRSADRTDVFVAKVIAAFAFCCLLLLVLASSSICAGLIVVGKQPLIDLSGALVPAHMAVGRVALAWLSVAPACVGFTAIALVLSLATRNGAAAIGLPVVGAFAMQLCAMLDGAELPRRLLLVSSFSAWHGLLNEHPYHGALTYGIVVGVTYTIASVAIAYRLFRDRDFA
jgi:ABC-2 type transport system permease protein